MLFSFNTSWVRDIEFPKGTSLSDVVTFLPEFHHVMLRANQDEGVAGVILQAPGPLAWAAGRSAIDFWIGPDGKKIIFQANALLWSLAFLLFLFEIAWLCFMYKKERKWPIGRDETVLLAGYIMNYLPFFLIARPMYLYHYFTALILLFLLVPKIAPRMIDCLAKLSRDRLFAFTLAYFALFLCLVNFFLLLPTTYGF
jgi:dolichyl-phosphate-mannose-protein mannosyltransferase